MSRFDRYSGGLFKDTCQMTINPQGECIKSPHAACTILATAAGQDYRETISGIATKACQHRQAPSNDPSALSL
jgi:hypothetical protein